MHTRIIRAHGCGDVRASGVPLPAAFLLATVQTEGGVNIAVPA